MPIAEPVAGVVRTGTRRGRNARGGRGGAGRGARGDDEREEDERRRRACPEAKKRGESLFEPPGRAPSRAREDASDARGAETLEARGIADDVIEGVRVGPREASSAREAKAAGETRRSTIGRETGDKTIPSSRCRFPGSFRSVFTRGWSLAPATRRGVSRCSDPHAQRSFAHERARASLPRPSPSPERCRRALAALAPGDRPPRARSLDPSGRTRLGTRPRGLSPIARAFAS